MTRSATIYRHQREKAAKNAQPFTMPLQLFREFVRETLGTPCHYCATPITESNFSFDHVIPLARNGTFADHNIDIICQRCNQIKGKLTNNEFFQLFRVINTWHQTAKNDILSRLRFGTRMFTFNPHNT